MQDFPYKSGVAQESKPSPFENDLVEYLQALEVGCSFTLLVFEGYFWSLQLAATLTHPYMCVQVPKR